MLTIPIEELVRDKRVILVGNSVEMMHYEYGDFIDSFDISKLEFKMTPLPRKFFSVIEPTKDPPSVP